LALLEGPGDLREIAPGIDAMPLGAGLVLALVVLPALLGCDVEDDVLFVVLSGVGFCVLSETADEDDFVEHGVWLRFFWFVPLSAVHACPEGVPRDPLPRRLDGICGRGPELASGEESAPRRGAQRVPERRACVRRVWVLGEPDLLH
jgi:hypothetical protein